MMRAVVALLLVANVVFFAWSRGWLDTVAGVRATGDREPERLARQVHPEVVRILTPQAVAAAASAAESRLACLEAGPFDDAAVGAAEAALATTLPSGTWARASTERPSGWIVYVGRFPSREAMQRREEELARQGVDAQALRHVPELEPGLELARFRERDEAGLALADLARRGVQGGRLVQLRALPTVHMLRVDRADPDLATKVAGLRLDALGGGFHPCPRPAS